MRSITLKEAAELLLTFDNIAVLMHKSPDGDTIGCGYALCAALRKLGKKAQPYCSDPIPKIYSYLTDRFEDQQFEAKNVVSVDVAAEQLFGDGLAELAGRVELCIDHHGSNTGFAECGIVDPSSGACAQVVLKIIELMGAGVDEFIADAVFTGISTDTGCFRYGNAKADSFRMAADMIDKGAQSALINRLMFETKTRERLELEKLALNSMRFYCGNTVAAISVTKEMLRASGAGDDDIDGIASVPRQIVGVKAGITIREKDNGVYRISLRTTDDVDASAICALFGGGGHRAAAGCSIEGTAEEVERMIVGAAEKMIRAQGR